MTLWRDRFPIFAQKRDLVYLDSAATTQKPLRVLEAVTDFYARTNANIHRGVYPLGEAATEAYESARHRVARFLNGGLTQTVFVRNATEAVNLVANTWGVENVQAGDTVLVTMLEHHANFVPWQQLARRQKARFRVAPIDETGELDLDRVEDELRRGVRLFAVTMASNVLGTLPPVRELTRMAHRYGATVVLDAAQAAPHMPLDVQALEADFLVLSGHKMYGPTGIGVLWGRDELLRAMPPFLFGGDMIAEVHVESTRFAEPPYKFEAGTPAIAEAVGLGAAIDFIENIGFAAIADHERLLTEVAWQRLSRLPGARLLGPPAARRAPLISFVIDGIHPHDIAGFAGASGVSFRAGHHCAQPLHDHLGVPATTRVSFGIYNRVEDLDALLNRLEMAIGLFAPERAGTVPHNG